MAGREPQGSQGCLGHHPRCSGCPFCPCGQPSSQAISPGQRPCAPSRWLTPQARPQGAWGLSLSLQRLPMGSETPPLGATHFEVVAD